jgi:hypothetical protein
MSQYTVITDGYGTFGSASFVITDGYSISDEVRRKGVLQLESGIPLEMSLDSSITITLNTESTINTAMELSSLIELEAA